MELVSYMLDLNIWPKLEDLFLGFAYPIATDVHVLQIRTCRCAYSSIVRLITLLIFTAGSRELFSWYIITYSPYRKEIKKNDGGTTVP
jgi:hypothetical protein